MGFRWPSRLRPSIRDGDARHAAGDTQQNAANAFAMVNATSGAPAMAAQLSASPMTQNLATEAKSSAWPASSRCFPCIVDEFPRSLLADVPCLMTCSF